MNRLLSGYWKRLNAILAFALLFGLMEGADVLAQSTDNDPSVSDEEAGTPTASENVWFVIAPEGKSNGEYFDIELDAGESTTARGTIGNGSAVPVTALIYAADASSGVNGGFLLGNSEDPVSAPTTWIDFPTTTYNFEPGEMFEAAFTVSVPAGTAPGQYITGIAVETSEAEPMAGTAPFLVKYRLAAAVLITVPGPVSAEFEVGDISILTDETTSTVSGEIRNLGNIRVRPSGTLRVVNADGATVVDAPIEMGSVYAGDTTTFETYLPAPLPEGRYTVDIVLEDADTGATAARSAVDVDVASQEAAEPVTISGATFTPMPSADNVVFVQVAVTISNAGQPLAGGEVTLLVYRDGELVDEVQLATAMTLQSGDTAVEQPYIPASGEWEAGAYTFEISLSANDPVTGTSSVIGTHASSEPVIVP